LEIATRKEFGHLCPIARSVTPLLGLKQPPQERNSGIGVFIHPVSSNRQIFFRVAKGYLAAAVVGISLGILVGVNPIIHRALDPIFQFLRMIAP